MNINIGMYALLYRPRVGCHTWAIGGSFEGKGGEVSGSGSPTLYIIGGRYLIRAHETIFLALKYILYCLERFMQRQKPHISADNLLHLI